MLRKGGIEHFNYRATIGQIVKNNRLAPILDISADRIQW
jgi:hypothetical protein